MTLAKEEAARLAAVEARAEKATRGPLLSRNDDDYYQGGLYLGRDPYHWGELPSGKRGEIDGPAPSGFERGDTYFRKSVCRMESDDDEDFFANAQVDVQFLAALCRRLARRVEALESALRFQDPRNAAERYDRIADEFERKTGMRAPGRSYPLAMGASLELDAIKSHKAWRKFCNEWHERWFDAALASPSTEPQERDE